MVRLLQAVQIVNAQPLLTIADQMDIQKYHQQDQRQIKRLMQELCFKNNALAAAML